MSSSRQRLSTSLVLLGMLVAFSGCPSSQSPPSAGGGGTSAGEDGLELLVTPFDPPTLEELNEQVTWEDQPVEDAMDRYLAYKKEHPSELSVEDALKLKNDSDENNEKILSALGSPPKSDDEVDYEATMNRRVNLDIKSSNPILISSVAEMDVTSLTGISFITIDWDLIPFADADVVESWQSSSDRMYDKIVLRDDLVWSDGKPITAHDVAFSYLTIMTKKVPAVAVRSGTDELKWVHAYDDKTIVFFHKQPLATNVWNISFPIIPKHVYKDSLAEDPELGKSDYHINLELNPVCGGPYKLIKRTKGQEILVERREDWYMKDGKQIRRKPYFKQVRFRVIEDPNTALLAMKDGSIDDIELTAEQWVAQTADDEYYSKSTKAMGTEWSFGYIGWNVKNPLFEDVRVRKAMAYALDHDEMNKSIFYGLYSLGQGIYHPDAWMAPDEMPEPYHQDLKKAGQLLDEAGWSDTDGDGIRDKEINGNQEPFEFTLIIGSGSDTALKIANLLKLNLDQIGINCTIKPTEFTVMQENARTHRFQAMMAGWGTGADPSMGKNIWTTRALEEGGRNYSQYTNPEVDRLYQEGEKEFDREKRGEIYAQIHKILWEDQPYMWLYYRSSFYGFNKDIRGYMFSPRGPYSFSPGFSALWKPKKK